MKCETCGGDGLSERNRDCLDCHGTGEVCCIRIDDPTMRMLNENQTEIIAEKHSPSVNDFIRINRGPLTREDCEKYKDSLILNYTVDWYISDYHELIGLGGTLSKITAWAVLLKGE